MTPEHSPGRGSRADDADQPSRWERLHAWSGQRAVEAVVLVTAALVLLLAPDSGLFRRELMSVGIGLDVVDFAGLVLLAFGLVLCVLAGTARLLGIGGRRLG